jgi:hypothetical protein
MKGNGGQKNGTFVPGCCDGWGGGGVNWEDVDAKVDDEVEVEELGDWDDVAVDIPLPVVPEEVPPTEPESTKNHFQTSLLTQSLLHHSQMWNTWWSFHCNNKATILYTTHK